MGRITTLDEFEKCYREGLGEPLAPRPWREVTLDWLQRHGDGSGDYNPLFRVPEYAARGPHRTLVGSPSFVFSIAFGANASIWGHIPPGDVAMSDLSILYQGADILWHRPVFLGDRVRAIETPVGIERGSSRQLGETVLCSGRTDYFDHRGELLATMTNRMLRFVNPGRGVESAAATDDRPRIAPDPLVWQRTRRGAEPRYGEDVRAGEELPELPKGTYTMTELYLFSHGTLSTSRSKAVSEGTIDMGAGGRADAEYARRSRSQAASFDYGPQRITWLAQVVADWMGDHGGLLSLSARLRRPNLVGDTNTVVGTVVGDPVPDGDGFRVEVRAAVVNHEGTETAVATAVVRLPARGSMDENPALFAADAEVPDSPYA